MKPLAVYIHVPFCARKCAYCDFASFAGQEGLWDEYFLALNEEMDAWATPLRAYEARSVFFGGGTPSLVGADKIAGALAHLRRHLPFAPDVEITLEANPGTLDEEKLQTYCAAGVNRLSIGVQSFDGGLLKTLGRIHTPEMAAEALFMARDAGFDNLSLDLMYALPGQDMGMWRETLDRALEMPVSHISAYSLIVEEGTPLADWVEAGKMEAPGDDLAIEMQRYAISRLERAGLKRYEISNFAQAGRESRHNLTYWQGGEYLGLGSAAHSLMGNLRFSNPPEIARYLAGERRLDVHERSLRDRKEEELMLATRTVAGLNLEKWKRRFGEDFVSAHGAALQKMTAYGFVEIADGQLRLTPAGMEIQDSVVLELMDD